MRSKIAAFPLIIYLLVMSAVSSAAPSVVASRLDQPVSRFGKSPILNAEVQVETFDGLKASVPVVIRQYIYGITIKRAVPELPLPTLRSWIPGNADNVSRFMVTDVFVIDNRLFMLIDDQQKDNPGYDPELIEIGFKFRHTLKSPAHPWLLIPVTMAGAALAFGEYLINGVPNGGLNLYLFSAGVGIVGASVAVTAKGFFDLVQTAKEKAVFGWPRVVQGPEQGAKRMEINRDPQTKLVRDIDLIDRYGHRYSLNQRVADKSCGEALGNQ